MIDHNKGQLPKTFWAGLFNTAINNLNNGLVEIAKRLKINGADPKNLIQNIFTDSLALSEWDFRFEVFQELFPFIKTLNHNVHDPEVKESATRAEFTYALIRIVELIYSLRHYTTHYYHPPIAIEPYILIKLDEMLLDSVLQVKKKRFKSEENLSLLPKQYEEEFRSAKGDLKKINKILDAAFDHMVFKRNHIYFLTAEMRTSDGSKKLSSSGAAFLLSFFLSKKQTDDFLSQLKGFKATNQLMFLATRWVFTHNCYKIASRHLKSQYDEDAFILQIVEELAKCPAELYKILSAQDKDEFFEDVNEFYKPDKGRDCSLIETKVQNLVKMVRTEDRFAYFVIRFLDQHVPFPNLRFQLALGNYVFHHETKVLGTGGNLLTERYVKRKYKYFERLSLAQAKKDEYFSSEKNTLGEIPGWEEYPNVHYLIDKGNIPIFLKFRDNFPKPSITAQTNLSRPTNDEVIEELLGTTPNNHIPVAYLSIHELGALIHCYFSKIREGLKKLDADNAHTKKDISQRRKAINELAAGEVERRIISSMHRQSSVINNSSINSPKKSVPKKLRRIVSGEKEGINKYLLIADLHKEIELSKARLKEYNRFESDNRSGRFNKKQRGEIAVDLTKDVKKFMLREVRQNWKGYQVRELQKALALFESKKEFLLDFLSNDLGVSSSGEVPKMIFKVLKKDNIESFVKSYYRNKVKILQQWVLKLTDVVTVDKDHLLFNFFDRRNYLVIEKAEYISRLNEHPMNIPRGIFDDRPTAQDLSAPPESLAEWFVESNTAPKQIFYNFTRYYQKSESVDGTEKVFRLILNPQKGFKEQIPLSIQNFYGHREQDNFVRSSYSSEKRIRRIARQDFFLLEIVKYLFNEKFNEHKADYSLSSIFLRKKEKEELRAVAFLQSERSRGTKTKNIIKEDHILSKLVKVELFNGRIVDQVALKSVGRFRNLLHDQVVKAIVSYDEIKVWSRSDIEWELDAYHKVRHREFFGVIHELEKNILNSVQNKLKITTHPKELEDNSGTPSFKHYIATWFLDNQDREMFVDCRFENLSESTFLRFNALAQKLALITIIRNKFAHDQFPDKFAFEQMSRLIPKENKEAYASYYVRFIQTLVVPAHSSPMEVTQ